MPRRRKSLPQLCHHKPSGRAVVYIGRTAVYLGPYDSDEAREAYGRLVADLAQGRTLEAAKAGTSAPSLKVEDLLLRYVTEEMPRFAPDEQRCQKGAIRILRQMFGDAPVAPRDDAPNAHFGPLKLRLVRNAMVAGDPDALDPDGNKKPRRPWSRDFVNKQVKRLLSIFRWGISWELVPQSIAEALATVRPLRVGETEAPDYPARRSVPEADLKAVRDLLSARQRDIFDLLLLTGARPGELLGLKISDVERTGDVWRAELKKHKTAHKGKQRVLLFSRPAQAILLRYMKADPDARFFPLRRDTYGAAVRAACEKAFGMPKELRRLDKSLPPAQLAELKRRAKEWRQKHVFTPHWLRHTTATKLMDDLGTESAQRVLGHAGKAMTEHYGRAAERVATAAVKRLAGD